jgi:hypothetical protein
MPFLHSSLPVLKRGGLILATQPSDQNPPFQLEAAPAIQKCAQPGCGKVLAPRNRSGYCTQHHRESDRVDKRFCAECGKRLRRNLKDDVQLCLTHRLAKLPQYEPRYCKKCGKPIRQYNSAGYCPAHWYLSRLNFKWATCKEPGCGNRVRPDNEHGYCREHRFAGKRGSTERELCNECGKTLRSDNTTGYCQNHRHRRKRREPKLCKEPGCATKLGGRNESGYCRVHYDVYYAHDKRDAARRRTEEYRARQKAKIADAEVRLTELQDEVSKQRALVERLKAKQGGRPRTREDDVTKYGPRVMELRAQGKSWPMIARIMKVETGQEGTATRWRLLVRSLPTPSPRSAA